MAGTIVNNPVVQFFDNNGNPLAGGKITTYLSNTTTPASTWQNEGLSVLNTNPIILNSRGEATIWLTPDIQYTFVLTDTNDNLIQTVNDIYGSFQSVNGINASVVSYTPSGTGALATTVEKKLREQVSVKDFGAVGDGVVDDTAAIQLAINTGRTVWFPNGTYSVTTLDVKQRYPHIVGESMVGTIIKARSAVTALIDAFESIDGQVVPLFISNMTLDANSLATRIVNARYRHMSNIENVYFINATAVGGAGFFGLDTFLFSLNNCRFTNCYDGLNFFGSNHRSTVNSCSFTGCINTGITCDSQGTALDGNNALVFNNCDVEFGTSLGAYLKVSDAAFYGCYMGENLNGPSFFVDAGNILVSAGVVFYGHTVNSFAVSGTGGRVLFDKCKVNGQTNGSLFYLMSGGTENFYKFEDCDIATVVGGDPTISGDRLDYGPPAVVFAPRLGKQFTPVVNNATVSDLLVGNGRRITCTNAPGPTPIIGLTGALDAPSTWVDGEPLYLVLVYRLSTVGSADIRLSGAPLGGAPTSVLGFPPNASSITTYFKLDASATSSAFTIIELLLINCAVNDFVEIQECFLADNRMLQNSAAANIRNLYKC